MQEEVFNDTTTTAAPTKETRRALDAMLGREIPTFPSPSSREERVSQRARNVTENDFRCRALA